MKVYDIEYKCSLSVLLSTCSDLTGFIWNGFIFRAFLNGVLMFITRGVNGDVDLRLFMPIEQRYGSNLEYKEHMDSGSTSPPWPLELKMI